MRKLPILFTTLLCTSLAFAQEEEAALDASAPETEAVEEAAAEPAAEEQAATEEAAPAEEVASEEAAPAEPVAEESAPVEEAAAEPVAEEPADAAAEAPAEEAAPKKEFASAAPVNTPAAVVDAPATMAAEEQLNTADGNMDKIAENLESTLMGKDDAPLAVSGFMAFRLKNFHYSDPSEYLASDKARTAVDAMFKANIVAIDFDPGASHVNQLNRIKLMMTTAHKNLEDQLKEDADRDHTA